MNIGYTLRRRNRKSALISISGTGEVTLSVPLGWTAEQAEKIIAGKKTWIAKHLAAIRENAPKRIKVPEGSLLYLGEIYTFRKNISMGRFWRIDTEGKTVFAGIDLTERKNAAKFYKERAAFILPGHVSRMAEENGFEFAKATVRNTKRRWGSCTSKKIITLSERLILAPPYVIDAIALHELVHTEIMNHSKDFYARLESVCPFYKEAEKWLKEKFPLSYPPA